MEWKLKHGNQTETLVSCWCYPQASDGKKHVSNTITIPNDKIVSVEEGTFFNQVNPECTLKATNFKIVVNPMGEGNAPQPNRKDMEVSNKI